MSERTTRREVLVTMAAAACAGASLPGCAMTPVMRLSASPEGRIMISRVDFDRARGDGNAVLLEVPGAPERIALIYVLHTDTILAFGATCTHQQCEVRPGKRFLTCPCHGSTYDFRGNVVRGPAEKPLTRLEVSHDALAVRIGPKEPE